ncbi:MAG: uroporphyrinogen-III synthase [Oscillatoriales cyanobacterium SM2_2_1]|nr:uroporphyrinogen-III synthase [Oscillatoriales cyanobacterium SM2_2_1]
MPRPQRAEPRSHGPQPPHHRRCRSKNRCRPCPSPTQRRHHPPGIHRRCSPGCPNRPRAEPFPPAYSLSPRGLRWSRHPDRYPPRAGARVTVVPAYDTQSALPTHPQDLLEAIANETVDILTFTSSKTVRHCRQMLPHWQPQRVQLASIGPQTSITCRQLFGRADIEAEPYTLDGLLEAIIAAVIHKNLRHFP